MQSPTAPILPSCKITSTNNSNQIEQPQSKATPLLETMPQVRAQDQPVTDSYGSVAGTHGTASICFSDGKKLSIDEDLSSMLSDGSSFFALQLKQRNVVIALPHVNLKVFRLYMAWLYNHNVDAHLLEINGEGDIDWQWLCHSYLLGLQVQDGTYCDLLTDILKANMLKTSKETFIRCIETIFSVTPGSSPLREILLDIALWKYPREYSRGNIVVFASKGSINSTPQQFSIALKAAQDKIRLSEISPFKYGPDPCRYHCHPRDKACHPKIASPITSDIFDLVDDWAQCFIILFDATCSAVRALSRATSSTCFVYWKYLKPVCKAAWSKCKKLFKRRPSGSSST